MSAFVVDKEHIDALLRAAMGPSDRLYWYHEGRSHELDYANADEVGAMLWAENVKSVEYRYADSSWNNGVRDLPGPSDLERQLERGYRYNPEGYNPKPVEGLKALSCYEYQSCEHPGWEASSAYAFCQALKGRLVDRLPGYEEAEWGTPRPKVRA